MAIAAPSEISANHGKEVRSAAAQWALAERLEGEAYELELEAYRIDLDAPPVQISAPGVRPPAIDRAIARHLEAARQFENLSSDPEYAPRALWRGARAYWSAGEALPVENKSDRLEYFTQSDVLASRGIGIDPDCAGCLLWKFIALGRLSTTAGTMEAIRQVPEMAELLDRALELEPTHVDSPTNSTMGNLHYASAIFYRVLPDWFWLGWILGVRGDKERALSHAQAALVLHPSRLDYRVELGSQLLCQGATRRRGKARLEQGATVLESALLAEPTSQGDLRQLEAARIMLREPEKSCGFTGDTWLEINEGEARRSSR